MTTTAVVVGVDVAKDRLDVAVRPSGEVWSEANDETGITTLVERLRPLRPALIVCEATGGFERAAIAALAAAGFPVVVANPRQVRDFARATGQLAKTDQLDAAILALFAERFGNDPAKVFRCFITKRQRSWFTLKDRRDDFVAAARFEGRESGHHLVKHNAKAPDIGALIHGPFAQLFGRHVADRAHLRARLSIELGHRRRFIHVPDL